jgi:hypothetical protein
MKKFYQIDVVSKTYTDVTRERVPDERWDADDLAHHTSIYGVRSTEIKDREAVYGDMVTPFEVVDGEDYYLVYVTYSTGDSFHNENGCVNYIDLFKTRAKAEACAKAIEEHYKLSDNATRWNAKKVKPPKGYSEWTLTYLNEEGKEVSTHVSWAGYFERLEYVTVESVHNAGPVDEGMVRYRY